MNTEELKVNLDYLVGKYIVDPAKRAELRALIQCEGLPPVKAIMADIASIGTQADATDSDLIKDIAFYYL